MYIQSRYEASTSRLYPTYPKVFPVPSGPNGRTWRHPSGGGVNENNLEPLGISALDSGGNPVGLSENAMVDGMVEFPIPIISTIT